MAEVTARQVKSVHNSAGNWEPLRGVEQESGVTKAMSELELT